MKAVKHRAVHPAALLPLVLLLAGCADLFEFNLIQGLDPIRLPDASSLEEMEREEGVAGVLDYLDEELGSPSFVDRLGDDPQAAAAVGGYLDEQRASAPGLEDRQRAAVLDADFHLRLTGGEELVNASVSAMLDGDLSAENVDTAAEAEQFLKDFLPAVMPPEALQSRAAFDALLTGFQEAWAAYEQFGQSDLSDPPASINLGDVAQKALVACLITGALAEGPGSLYGSEETARDNLWLLAGGGDPPDPTGGLADPFDNDSLNAIFSAAGLDPADFR